MKKIVFIFACLLLVSCGALEFVLKDDVYKTFDEATLISVNGDDANVINGFLVGNFGSIKENEDPVYKLNVYSSKTMTADVIEKDGTASKFKTQYIISYNLYNLLKKCTVLDKEITTIATFNAKSGGYSFGTDFSQNESKTLSINKNLNEFMSSLNQIQIIGGCNK